MCCDSNLPDRRMTCECSLSWNPNGCSWKPTVIAVALGHRGINSTAGVRLVGLECVASRCHSSPTSACLLELFGLTGPEPAERKTEDRTKGWVRKPTRINGNRNDTSRDLLLLQFFSNSIEPVGHHGSPILRRSSGFRRLWRLHRSGIGPCCLARSGARPASRVCGKTSHTSERESV